MATAFGVFTGILTVIGFLQNLPTPDNSQYTSKYRIHAGLDTNGGLSNGGGGAPDIRVWNEGGQFLGANYDPGHISSGSYKDINVGLSQPHQPTYTLFTGNDDAICIAYISQTWAQGDKYAWVGNWADAWACGREWYYANVYLDGRLLNCAWLDRNGDTAVTAFQVHFPEFLANDQNSGKDRNYYCQQGPPHKYYYDWEPSAITYWIPAGAKRSVDDGEIPGTAIAEGPKKPGSTGPPAQPPPAYNETRLIQSSVPEHSAVKLCESPSSRGPDLVSLHEQKFCEMTTREVFPLCTGDEAECFDLDTKEVRGVSLKLREIGGEAAKKSYSEVMFWDGE